MSSPAGSTAESGMRAPSPARGAYQTLVVARVGERRFAIPATAVERVLRMAAFSPMPELPAGVVGLLNLHGAALPVIDARPLFQEPSQPPRADHHLIVLGEGEPRVLWVDGIDHVPDVPWSAIDAIAGRSPGDPVEAAVRLDGEILPLLMPGALVPGGLARGEGRAPW